MHLPATQSAKAKEDPPDVLLRHLPSFLLFLKARTHFQIFAVLLIPSASANQVQIAEFIIYFSSL